MSEQFGFIGIAKTRPEKAEDFGHFAEQQSLLDTNAGSAEMAQ